MVAEVLLHFERQLDRLVLHLVVDGQRVVDAGQLVRKFDVHHRTDDLNDFAFVHTCTPGFVASSIAPELAAGDLQQFLGDVALPQLVVFERQILDQASALSVAFFIDTMRALCSLALAFSSTW